MKNKITLTTELEAAFAAFRKSDRPNIFADSINNLCEAEVRRIHARSGPNRATTRGQNTRHV